MLDIAKHLDDVPLILLCGRNQALAEALRALRRRAAQAVVGFTDDVPRLLRLGDFFIGKPGPGSLSEAVHLGLPVLTFDNANTMPQERYNVRWLKEQGLGRAVRHTRELRKALDRLPQAPRSGTADPAAPANRAVFEVVDILDELMRWAQPRPAGSLVDGSCNGLPVARAADASSLGWAVSR
jgi:1,2-diacylglycerol 3-beta-galactosyltransferase